MQGHPCLSWFLGVGVASRRKEVDADCGIGEGGAVVALAPKTFEIESLLQGLLNDYPRLLLPPVDDYQERSIWTIGYEVGTTAGSLDLLCIDSTGEVWVIETKLAKNRESQKQVVGQVLGYASAIAAWSIDKLQAVAQEHLKKPLMEYLAEAVGMADASRRWWQAARSGRRRVDGG